MSLFWRVFAANAAILVAGGIVVALEGGPLHRHATLVDALDLALALLIMLVVNGLLLRRLFRPLERLAAQMEKTDVLRGGQRIPVTSTGEIGTLELAFNTMIERLEAERREAGARSLQAQEAERQRLARGLHDEVGQSMTAVLLQLKGLRPAASAEQLQKLDGAQEVVKRSLDDVRRLAQELRPELLDHLGLTSAVAELVDGFEQRSHVTVRRRLQADLPPLDPSVELVVYRVAQESLTNISRHAEATAVDVSLEHGNNTVVLRVVDNGRGLEGQPEGGGLRGIRERALIVGGAVAIKAGPDGGVEVRLEVPAKTA
jgi:two-component system sensor histidine kinase UhpB